MLAGRPVTERLSDQVFVGEWHHRNADARQATDLRGEHAGGVDDHLGLDVAPLRADALDAAVGDRDVLHARVREHLDAPGTRSLDQGVGEQRGIQIAVGGQVGGAAHPVGDHQREQLAGLFG